MARNPQSNQSLARIFQEMAQMLELLGEDRFRVIAHDRAARLIAEYPEDLCAIAAEEDGRKRLLQIDGIGAKIADKFVEFASAGAVAEHQALLARVPAGLLDVLRIPGLGPKTVRAMWQTCHICSLEDLRRAIEDGSILQVPRMGAKTVENLKAALTFSQQGAERLPLGLAWPLADVILHRLRNAPGAGVVRVEAAGSLRRGRETIGDLDFLASADNPGAVADAFVHMPEVTQVLASGESKCSVRLTAGSAALQADLRIVPPGAFGAALLYFTGSREHNIRLRERALKRGTTLNEYGLFPEDKKKTPPQQRGVAPIAADSEEANYRALDLPWVPPELREDRPLDQLAAEAGAPLITLADIRAELHAHTTASDGAMSILELVEFAQSRGFHTIAVTDHSQSSVIANGLKPDRLRRHIDEVRDVASRVKGITVLAGSEVDILADGSLDYEDDLLAQLDIVVASPHAALRQSPEAATQRLLRAINHPLVHILGHPTGRLIQRREGLAPDIAAIAMAAAERRVALEINANWMRLDLRDSHVRAALSVRTPSGEGALIAINCDDHAREDFENLRYGVATARRGGLTPDRCVNTWPTPKLLDWLRSKR